MALTDDLRDWIARVDGTLDPDELPRLETAPRDLPEGFEAAVTQFHDRTEADDVALNAVGEASEAILRNDAWNATPRFFLLHVHYWMYWWTLMEGPRGDDDFTAAERRQDVFRRLLALVPPRDVPPSWSVIRWEIASSYLASAWHRALRLYGYAESAAVRDSRDIALMRGSFRYLLGRDGHYPSKRPNSLFWEPRVLGSNEAFLPPNAMPVAALDQVAVEGLYARSVEGFPSHSDAPDPLDEVFSHAHELQRSAAETAAENLPDAVADFELLKRKESLYLEARHDLDKGVRAYDGAASRVYDALRARCDLEVGNYSGAAHLFHRVLADYVDRGFTTTDRFIGSPTFAKKRPIRADSILITAKCYRAADNADSAFQVLDLGLKEFPYDRKLLLERAELAAQEARPLEALESYRKALAGTPEEKWDLPARLASILGDAFVQTKDYRTVIERAFQQDREKTHLIAELVSLYWRPFTDLTAGARDSWLMGLYQLSVLPRIEPKLRVPLVEGAVVAFSKAVERELRERIFYPARTALGPAAQSWAGTPAPEQPEHRFILFARGKTKLTLGQMQRILSTTQMSGIGLSSNLKTWLRSKSPRWEALVEPLQDIVEERNPAAHGESDREANIDRLHAACKRSLEILTGRG